MVTRGQSRRHVAKRVNQFAKVAASVAGTAGIAAGNFAVKNLLKYFSAPATPKKKQIGDYFNMTPKKKSSPGITGERKSQPYKRRSYKSASTSKSRGFFKRGTKKRTYLDRSANGVTFCREEGRAPALDNDVDTTYIGHATVTPRMLIEEVFYALVKWFAIKMGSQEFVDFGGYVKPFGTDNYVVELIGKQTPDSVAVAICTFVCIPGTSTWKNLADDLIQDIITYMKANPYVQLTQLRSFSSNVQVREDKKIFDLTRAYFLHGCKSTMKIQNRTINSAGNDETDDVDNVPLYGKSYEGNGNFMKYRTNSTFSAENVMIGLNPNTSKIGNISINYAAFQTGKASNPLAEPPKPSQLINVKRSGKCHLDPGEIKTSVLHHTIRMGLNTLLRKLFIINETTEFTIRNDLKLGNYRIFALEKMLKIGTETATTQIKVAYEIDQKSHCTFSAPRTPVVNTVLQLTNS